MIGKTISHYKILEKIGSGGMGIVYKAEDINLKRLVALKFLPPELIRDEEARERFIHEAQSASALDHSNICSIHEINKTDDGLMFISMGYYEGKTLKDKISQSPFNIDQVMDIANQIAQGLLKANEKGIIHRDIKPANIFITNDSIVKILDFGLAKLRGQTRLTKIGSTMGTVSYMSPEQIRGEETDQRTDIWSFGIVLYEMLTGQLPFKGEYDNAIMYSIMNEQPEALAAVRMGIPMELERIVNKCLEKKVTDRYQHADELIVDLNKVKRKSESQESSYRRTVIKKPSVLLILLIIVLVIVSGYFILNEVIIIKKHEIPNSIKWENSIAVLPFKNISPESDQEYFCDGMTEQIISTLCNVQKLKVISRTSVMKFKNSLHTIPEIAAILNVKYILEGSVRKSLNQIRVTAQLINVEDDSHVWAEDFDEQLIDVFKLQDNISEKIVKALLKEFPAGGIEKTKIRQTTNIEAYEFFLKGKYYHEQKFIITRDEESFKLSEMMFYKAIHLDSSFALPYTALADLYHTYYALGSNTLKKKEYLRLLNEYAEKAFRIDSTLAYNYLVKGRIHQIYNEIDKSFQCFKKAVQLSPNVGWMNYSLGIFFLNRGLCYKAVKYIEKAIKLDPLNSNFYLARGISHVYIGNFQEAENDYKKALELEPTLVTALEHYVHLLIEKGRLKEAEKLLEQIKTIQPADKVLQAKFFAAIGERKVALDLMGSNTNLQIYSLLGMRSETVSFLQNTLDQDKKLNTSYYFLYKTNPCYAKVRNDPQFQKFLMEHKKIYEENVVKYKDM